MIDMTSVVPLESPMTGTMPGMETKDTGLFRYLMGLQLPNSNPLESEALNLEGLLPDGLTKDKKSNEDSSIEALAGALAAMTSSPKILSEIAAQAPGVTTDLPAEMTNVSAGELNEQQVSADASLQNLLNLGTEEAMSSKLDLLGKTRKDSELSGLFASEAGLDAASVQSEKLPPASLSEQAIDASGEKKAQDSGPDQTVAEVDPRTQQYVSRPGDRLEKTKAKAHGLQANAFSLTDLDSKISGSTTSASASEVAMPTASNPAEVVPLNESHAEVLRGIETMAYRGGGKMVVSLQPAELGKLELQVTARGKRVEVEMFSDSEQAKAILESSLPQLKESLASQNFELTRAEVRHGAGQGFEFGGGQSFRQSFRDTSDSPSRQPSYEMSRSLRTFAAAAPLRSSATSELRGSEIGRLDVRI